MCERMGGIKRLGGRGEDPHPDLIASRIQEQREREKKEEEAENLRLKPKSKKRLSHRSKLKWTIIQLCIDGKKKYDSYECTIDQIYDTYHGERTGRDISKKTAIYRSIRSLEKIDVVKLRSRKVGRVELTTGAIRIYEKKLKENEEN